MKQIVNEHFRFKLQSKLYHHRRNITVKLKKPISIIILFLNLLFDLTLLTPIISCYESNFTLTYVYTIYVLTNQLQFTKIFFL